jgi:hypothetical protein
MRDLQKTIDYVERGMLLGLERKIIPPKEKALRPSIRAWHAPVSATANPTEPSAPSKCLGRRGANS